MKTLSVCQDFGCLQSSSNLRKARRARKALVRECWFSKEKGLDLFLSLSLSSVLNLKLFRAVLFRVARKKTLCPCECPLSATWWLFRASPCKYRSRLRTELRLRLRPRNRSRTHILPNVCSANAEFYWTSEGSVWVQLPQRHRPLRYVEGLQHSNSNCVRLLKSDCFFSRTMSLCVKGIRQWRNSALGSWRGRHSRMHT